MHRIYETTHVLGLLVVKEHLHRYPSPPDSGPDLSVHFSFFDRLALLELLLSARNGDREFELVVLIIHRNGYNCQSLSMFIFRKVGNLLLGEEESPWSPWVIPAWGVAFLKRCDVHPDDKCFIVSYADIGTIKRAASHTERLYLKTDELEPGVESFLEFKIESCFAVFDK